MKYAPDGIIKVAELERQLSLLDLEFDNSIFIDKISDGTICIMKDEYYLLNRPHAIAVSSRKICREQRTEWRNNSQKTFRCQLTHDWRYVWINKGTGTPNTCSNG